MALLQILLLLLYALPSLLLPITSNPLRPDETPDNLAYAALSLENRYEHESPRKIPKSIFIAPDVQPCPNGVMGRDNKCFNSQTFDVNQLDFLTSQLQSIVHDKGPTTSDYEDYDYDNYDSTESNEPVKFAFDLGFLNTLPSRDRNTFNDNIQNMPFLADNVDHKEQTSQKYSAPSSIGSDSTETENVVPTTSRVVSNGDEWADRILSDIKDTTQDEVKATTPIDVVITTPDESLLLFNDGISVSTTQKKVLVDADAFTNNGDEDVSSTENSLNPTTISDGNEDLSTTLINRDTLHVDKIYTNRHIEDNHIESTTPVDEKKIFDKELQSESLFEDDSSIGTSITVSDGTTEISENDVEVTTESLNSTNDKEFHKAVSISIPIPPFKSLNNSENPIVVVPTVEQVQIVTPVQQSTTTSRSTTSTHHRKKLNNQSIPSSTTHNSELQTAEHLDINDSMLNKKLIESVMKHELNEDAIETIDTNNRFLYTHLGTSTNEPEATTSTTMQPITQRSLLDQLRFINKFTEDSRKNNRFRFPEPTPLNIFSNFKGGTIKFPGPVQQRTNEPLFNRLIPDLIPKKPPEPTAERALFSWLPAGTSFNFNPNSGHSIPRFWKKPPLTRDQSMISNVSPEQSRSNSKSPTDNLYKDAPASEVYKVISSKNYKHDNR